MRSRTIIATPPGATIREQLQIRRMSQKEFAQRIEMSEKHVSHLINGEVALTPSVALKLEDVLGVPAAFWNNLEAGYQAKRLRAEEENQVDAELCILKKLPYRELVKQGWIKATKSEFERVTNMRGYFEVASLCVIESLRIPGIVYRKLSSSIEIDYKLLSWAQRAKVEARKVKTDKMNLQLLEKNLPALRRLTKEKPEDFFPQLQKMLAKSGVALVVLPHLGGSFLHGATFYDGDKIVLGVTVRGKDADRFWFSFFHEIGHILLGHVGRSDEDGDEVAADSFAADTLIPSLEYSAYKDSSVFTRESIMRFSELIGIDQGIVVGRLQNDKVITHSQLNDMKTQYLLA